MHSKVDNKLPPVCDKWGKLWFELSHPLFSIWRKSHLEQISTEAAICWSQDMTTPTTGTRVSWWRAHGYTCGTSRSHATER